MRHKGRGYHVGVRHDGVRRLAALLTRVPGQVLGIPNHKWESIKERKIERKNECTQRTQYARYETFLDSSLCRHRAGTLRVMLLASTVPTTLYMMLLTSKFPSRPSFQQVSESASFLGTNNQNASNINVLVYRVSDPAPVFKFLLIRISTRFQ